MLFRWSDSSQCETAFEITRRGPSIPKHECSNCFVALVSCRLNHGVCVGSSFQVTGRASSMM